MNGVCPKDASGALLPKLGILAAVKGDHQDFIALLPEVDGIGKTLHDEPADLPVNQGEPGAWSAEAELAPHFIPGQSRVRVVEMGGPAPVELGTEGRVDR